MIIHNDISSHIFIGILYERPHDSYRETRDLSGLNALVIQILGCFYLFTGGKADIHLSILSNH